MPKRGTPFDPDDPEGLRTFETSIDPKTAIRQTPDFLNRVPASFRVSFAVVHLTSPGAISASALEPLYPSRVFARTLRPRQAAR